MADAEWSMMLYDDLQHSLRKIRKLEEENKALRYQLESLRAWQSSAAACSCTRAHLEDMG